jgi:dUTP pyrophosphatase
MKVTKLKPSATAPAYASDGAACFDFFACLDPADWPDGLVIQPGATVVLGTGIAVAVPRGSALMMYSRYGNSYRFGVRLANSTSIIDADCDREVLVSLRNEGRQPFAVHNGDRVAQGMLIQAPRIELKMAPA